MSMVAPLFVWIFQHFFFFLSLRFSEVFDYVARNSHDDVFYEDDIWPGEDENGCVFRVLDKQNIHFQYARLGSDDSSDCLLFVIL